MTFPMYEAKAGVCEHALVEVVAGNNVDHVVQEIHDQLGLPVKPHRVIIGRRCFRNLTVLCPRSESALQRICSMSGYYSGLQILVTPISVGQKRHFERYCI
ncbi:unnamed protein product [Bursaphelenchus xylophilus]|uniref:(pine wood nematode) hypothetical protein n=1 Tax=Bursaphelenchus xylophilus TaxID=6326 RepID=A0A1I7SCP2_BURXY|nr:unnamed protein product [Bursaphelenchus xylophilus]CAG9093753.1 unnamed protein product [Bursaphelenchus xylophilus]